MKKRGLLLILGVLLAVFLVGCSGTEEPAPKIAKIPAIPHEVTQGMDCKSCHESGVNGAKITKHLDRPNCTSCHKVKQ
ncbi:hypothetical protein [Desulfosporosinus sp. BICA1-9]|uniref:hypothetical protein n=1 Tax=Desulfosporosinus sp. BICA1-9 TaxID=1531958 RepID=UPI00054B55CF|nr:hypothetical protein [Desulfosporosinus sp. BICA1-9]KJS87390.1 MAG: hypothetical protein JL57_14280 [Desulfosporosinus sp. BICA1-9]HBW35717.1 hypothetical protein [Desulfosporosinus sp.]